MSLQTTRTMIEYLQTLKVPGARYVESDNSKSVVWQLTLKLIVCMNIVVIVNLCK